MTILRTISGRIAYITDGVGEEGYEDFHITCLKDGRRMLQAQSVMTNDDLIRTTYLIINAAWQPMTAQMHLIKGDYTGSAAYDFCDDHVRFTGQNTEEGELAQTVSLESSVTTFGGHAIQNDAWMYGAFDRYRGDCVETILPNTVITSHAANGGDGPALTFAEQHHRYVKDEEITTEAGTFAARKYEFIFEDRPSIQYWITGEDYIIVRCRWDHLKQTYDVVDLQIRYNA